MLKKELWFVEIGFEDGTVLHTYGFYYERPCPVFSLFHYREAYRRGLTSFTSMPKSIEVS